MEARVVNIDRVLAKLKKQRRGIDKAIAALEKLRSGQLRNRKKVAKAKKRRSVPSRQSGGPPNQTEPEEHQAGTGAKRLALVPPARRIS